LKLQNFLAAFNKELYPEEFEAWEHGPVVPDIYHIFKFYVSNPVPIPEDYKDLKDYFVADECDLLGDALRVFSGFVAWELRELSHEEQPWIDAFNKGAGNLIDKKVIRDHFKVKYLK